MSCSERLGPDLRHEVVGEAGEGLGARGRVDAGQAVRQRVRLQHRQHLLLPPRRAASVAESQRAGGRERGRERGRPRESEGPGEGRT